MEIRKVLGAATAYAMAVRGGYTGTQEEYEALLASYGAVAAEAEQHKEDAEAYAVGKRDGTDVDSGDEAYQNNAKYYADQALSSKTDAESAKSDAQTAQGLAAGSATSASNSAKDAEAYAKGTREGTAVASGDAAYQNNAKYYAEQASGSASAASGSATSAAGDAEDAEAYAKGTRNGTDVGSSDPAYHNSASYHAGQASNSATSASNSATAAAGSASDAEAYAKGTRGGTAVGSSDSAYNKNAKYYAEQAEASATAAAGSAASLTVDSALSSSSTNPVQNKVVNAAVSGLLSQIDEVKDAIQTTTVCIDATDSGTYETAPSTRSFAHPFPFVAGKKYKATLTVNTLAFLNSTDTIRIQQSASTGTSTGNLLGGVFRIDNTIANPITAGAVYETEFIADEGCVNLLARYKFDAGSPELDLDVTLTEYISVDVDELKEDVQKKYADCTRKSRMLMGAHRGAEYFAPPNCVAAYEIAGKMGFPWAWLAQIRWSSSGTLYVMHDADVSITTNGTGNIQDLTDEYINSLLCNKITGYDYSQFSDDDLRVPTLEKAIQICLRYGMKMCFRIEPFPNEIETELHQTIWDNFETLVKAYSISADWCCYSGYNALEMIRCITLFGEDAELCPYIGSVSAQDVVDWFNAITSVTVKRKSVLLDASNLTLADVKLLHTNGIKVYAFTNSTSPTQAQMEQLATWGVDILQNPRYARIPIT